VFDKIQLCFIIFSIEHHDKTAASAERLHDFLYGKAEGNGLPTPGG
jgi:hypothetical protein